MNGHQPIAYSRLGLILARENVSVAALQRKLAASGVPVNVKSLYRLAENAPLQKIDLRITAAICNALAIALGDLISFEKPKAELHRLDPKMQVRLDALMSKSNEGQLTVAERKEFLALADQAHRVSMENARTLLAERKRTGASVRTPKKSVAPKNAAMAV